MSGYTKHMCDSDTFKAKNDLNKFTRSIITILPYDYSSETIVELLYKYYPYEMFLINEKHRYYSDKEKSLTSRGRKSRYNFPSLHSLIKSLSVHNKLISNDYKIQHQQKFDETKQLENIKTFSIERTPKIKKVVDKIEKAKQKTQQVEPEFLDSLMGLYDRKNTSQKDKLYIIRELQKYYCPKVIRFFSKKVDTEFNNQLREMAFFHLQSLGFQPVLRKQKYMRIPSKNEKRRDFLKNIYMKERYNIKEIPQELEYRIENSKEQKIKTYDFFISHSSADYSVVQMLVQHLNKNKKNIYCDWINDNDYLKRHLAGEATLNVILKRLQQSKELIFVISENSLKSNWCKYELNEVYLQKKEIYFIKKEDIETGNFEYSRYKNDWFIDASYKQMNLFEMAT
ncbi:TIR domain-containing protein [Paenibacillus amylolyticus]|uniref:TIR domain-containing protein n=1 Tax=Paenibacillus amylolyticus TaxID=1451 RepID=UPI003242C98E